MPVSHSSRDFRRYWNPRLAHWGAVAGADFFTTEVWTWRGLMTDYTVFVIDLASRRVQIVGSTTHPDRLFMRLVSRTLTMAGGVLSAHRVLICDRDAKWSEDCDSCWTMPACMLRGPRSRRPMRQLKQRLTATKRAEAGAAAPGEAAGLTEF